MILASNRSNRNFSNRKKLMISVVPSNPDILPLPDGRSGGIGGAAAAAPRPSISGGDQLEGRAVGRSESSNVVAMPPRIIGDCPPDTVCLHCHQTGNVKKIVDSNRIGGKSETLHEHCAEAWFKKIRNQT